MTSPLQPDITASISIQRAKARDFLAVASLDREAWRDAPYGGVIADGEHTWRIWCEHALVILALEGEQLLGVSLAFAAKPGLYCLHKVMVARAARGKGVGTKLLQAAADALDELAVDAYLTVAPGNAAAERLYRNFGFTESTLVHGYYREDEHRFVLTRKSQAARGTTETRP